MENASKALLIAGAILIAILLISVGIMVMNSADDVVGEAESSMSSTAIQTFNAQFTKYSGTQKGSSIKTLVNAVISSNATSDHQVTINTADASSYDTSTLSSTKSYTVSFDYTDGYISDITIQ